MQKLSAIIELTRPLNVVITFLVVFVAVVICSISFKVTTTIILACISASLVAASGNMINDYFDIEIDRINRPERPIPSGRISQGEVLILYLILALISLSLASLISISVLILVFITVLLLFLYSLLLKSIPFLGNLIVSLCTGLAFILGGIVTENYGLAVIPAVFAFLINLVRELVKDIEDREGDSANELRTFPIVFGIRATKNLITVTITLLIFSTFYPFITKVYNIEYFLIVLFLVDLPLIYFIKQIYSKNFFDKLSLLSFNLKLLMIFGLTAIFIGSY